MATAIKSYIGLAKQTGQSTLGSVDAKVTTDANFQYLLWNNGPGMTPQEVVDQLPQELGSGALPRTADKLAVNAAGQLEFIPRPTAIGDILWGLLGDVSTVTGSPVSGANTHTFKFASNEFDLPWWTFRMKNPLWAGEFTDCRIMDLTLTMNAAQRLQGTLAILGITPQFEDYADTSGWNESSQIDSGPVFLTCRGTAELPDGTSMQARNLTLRVTNVINIDLERIIGSYTPVGLTVISRAAMITFTATVTSAALYKKLQYTQGSGDDWDASLYKEANLDLSVESSSYITGTTPYKLSIHANGRTESDGDANIIWTVQPVMYRPNDKIVMQWTGFITEDSYGATDGPLSIQLVNGETSYS